MNRILRVVLLAAAAILPAGVDGREPGELAGGYRVSYVLRYQTSELRTEPGDRDLFWGGVSISRSF